MVTDQVEADWTLAQVTELVDSIDSWDGEETERKAAIMLLTVVTNRAVGFNTDKLASFTKIPRESIQDFMRNLRASGIITGGVRHRQIAMEHEWLQDQVGLVEFILAVLVAAGTVVTDRYKGPLKKHSNIRKAAPETSDECWVDELPDCDEKPRRAGIKSLYARHL